MAVNQDKLAECLRQFDETNKDLYYLETTEIRYAIRCAEKLDTRKHWERDVVDECAKDLAALVTGCLLFGQHRNLIITRGLRGLAPVSWEGILDYFERIWAPPEKFGTSYEPRTGYVTEAEKVHTFCEKVRVLLSSNTLTKQYVKPGVHVVDLADRIKSFPSVLTSADYGHLADAKLKALGVPEDFLAADEDPVNALFMANTKGMHTQTGRIQCKVSNVTVPPSRVPLLSVLRPGMCVTVLDENGEFDETVSERASICKRPMPDGHGGTTSRLIVRGAMFGSDGVLFVAPDGTLYRNVITGNAEKRQRRHFAYISSVNLDNDTVTIRIHSRPAKNGSFPAFPVECSEIPGWVNPEIRLVIYNGPPYRHTVTACDGNTYTTMIGSLPILVKSRTDANHHDELVEREIEIEEERNEDLREQSTNLEKPCEEKSKIPPVICEKPVDLAISDEQILTSAHSVWDFSADYEHLADAKMKALGVPDGFLLGGDEYSSVEAKMKAHSYREQRYKERAAALGVSVDFLRSGDGHAGLLLSTIGQRGEKSTRQHGLMDESEYHRDEIAAPVVDLYKRVPFNHIEEVTESVRPKFARDERLHLIADRTLVFQITAGRFSFHPASPTDQPWGHVFAVGAERLAGDVIVSQHRMGSGPRYYICTDYRLLRDSIDGAEPRVILRSSHHEPAADTMDKMRHSTIDYYKEDAKLKALCGPNGRSWRALKERWHSVSSHLRVLLIASFDHMPDVKDEDRAEVAANTVNEALPVSVQIEFDTKNPNADFHARLRYNPTADFHARLRYGAKCVTKYMTEIVGRSYAPSSLHSLRKMSDVIFDFGARVDAIHMSGDLIPNA